MSENAENTVFLESIIKIEPEEFETTQEKAAGDVSETNITDPVEPSKLGDNAPTDVDSFKSDESHSVETLARKGNEGKRFKDPQSCCICQKVVSSRQTLKEHLERFHLKTMEMSCDHCEKILFTKKAIIKHMRIIHGEKKFACDRCDYKTAGKFRLESHQLNHAAQTECPVCKKEVTSLKSHQRMHEPKKSCSICQKPVLPCNMKQHMKFHISQKCGECGETFESNEELRRHKLRSHFDGELHECHCGTVYRTKSGLKEHQQNHNEEETTCDVCEKHFSTKKTLKRHRKKQHGLSKEKVKVLNTSGPFICNKCGTKLSSRGAFQTHILVHQDATIFCDLCPRSFNQKCHAARHIIRDHLKFRPFQCDVCQHKVFTRRELELHKLQHGSKTKCEICQKRVANMTVHLRTHIKRKCPICGKKYSRDYLRLHLKIHAKNH